MSGLTLHFSNRTEVLIEELAALLREPLQNPFESEVIVIQSRGMARWISQQLALQHGVCANTRFLFPNAILTEIFDVMVGKDDSEELFSPDILQWRVMRVLPHCLAQAEFTQLSTYLGSDHSGLKAMQLAGEIANVLDHYSVYRPDLLWDWEKGKENHWQAILWRILVREGRGTHRALRQRKTLDRFKARIEFSRKLPTRVSVFGISQLPPFYLDVLNGLSMTSQVHFFFLNPTFEYWGEILSDKEQAKVKQWSRVKYGVDAEDHFETGHPLLASLGTLGREFFGMLLDRQGGETAENFRDPGEETLLHCIQSDILHLRDRGKDVPKKKISLQDNSLTIHSCHHPRRELEVLHNYLLSLFEMNPGLQPKDILVMTPDIETYAAYIEAAFQSQAHGRTAIPYSIADRVAKSESPLFQCFLKVLDLVGSRFKVTEVMDLLETPTVHARFKISTEEMSTIRQWVEETRIHWGFDQETRESQGVPGFSDNTWKAGLERLLLGYALTSQAPDLFEDILPYDRIEGSDGELLGRFLEMVEHLFQCLRRLEFPKTLTEWSETLNWMLESLLHENEENAADSQILRSILKHLEEVQSRSRFDQPIPIESLRAYLQDRLGREHSTFPFLTGGVTFCAMLPMRSIPFRVIAMIGLNHDHFPRQDRKVSFDLMAGTRRPGDRSLREEDQYLFLEALLSARDHLFISFIGQSPRDNVVLPPSVVVSELMDRLDQGFMIPAGGVAGFARHRLQGYHPIYFSGDTKRFSYSKADYEGLTARQERHWAPKPYLVEPLKEPGPEWNVIELRDFQAMLQRPCEFFFRRRLGVLLRDDAEVLQDSEPFSLDSLSRYRLGEEMVANQLKDRRLDTLFPYIQAQGILSPCGLGDAQYRELARSVRSFTERLLDFRSGKTMENQKVEIEYRGIQLRGTLQDIYANQLLKHRFAKLKPKDRLAIWVEHLLLQRVATDGYPKESVFVGGDGVWRYRAVEKSEMLLYRLLEFYRQGLRQPLRFFPRSSLAYAMAIFKGKSRDEALQSAERSWRGQEEFDVAGECDELYHWLGFREICPLDKEFENLALEIIGPLLECEQKEA
ncbi:MAG: exodeoxyribonuclease V subunit gamma [Terriglobia bacterium]